MPECLKMDHVPRQSRVPWQSRLPVDVCAHSLEPFIDTMMPNVADCDYNKTLLYLELARVSGGRYTESVILSRKRFPGGTDAAIACVVSGIYAREGGEDGAYRTSRMYIYEVEEDEDGRVLPFDDPWYCSDQLRDRCDGDQETKDRLWNAVRTAFQIFEKIPGNLCTTWQERLAWADTTTCVRCSFDGKTPQLREIG